MLTLVTGKPGDGKTQWTIKRVMERAEEEGRPVFYWNIEGCRVDGWTEIPKEDGVHWHERVPEGALIIIDEARQLFPQRLRGTDKIPDHQEVLERHRHYGWDIWVVTQHAMQVDTHVRRLCGQHVHVRRVLGMNYANVYVFDEVCMDPRTEVDNREATERFTYDKAIWKLYKSATIHTHKRRIPRKLVFVPLLLVGFGISGWLFWSVVRSTEEGVGGREAVASSQVAEVAQVVDDPVVKRLDRIEVDRVNYTSDRVRLVHSDPASAPIYNDARKVQSYPRPQCVANDDKCTCYSQQATLLHIADHTCRGIVRHGYFEPGRVDVALVAADSGPAPASVRVEDPAAGASGQATVTVVDTGSVAPERIDVGAASARLEAARAVSKGRVNEGR